MQYFPHTLTTKPQNFRTTQLTILNTTQPQLEFQIIEQSINKITIYIERWVETKNWFSTLLVKGRVDNKSEKSRLIKSKKRNIAKQSKVF